MSKSNKGKNIILFSPELDSLLQYIHAGTDKPSKSKEMQCQVKKVFSTLSKIKSMKEHNDRIWPLWLRTKRGPIGAFGNFDELRDEGEFESFIEFEEYWKAEYPEPIQWHELKVVFYGGKLYFTFSQKVNFYVDLETEEFFYLNVQEKYTKKLLNWLFISIIAEITEFLANPEKYNEKIALNLPLNKRFGKLKRISLWNCSNKYYRHDQELGSQNLKKFTEMIKEIDETTYLKSITLKDFLRYCEICYDANGYKSIKHVSSPREKYLKMADLRHGGLLDIAENDPNAFAGWYKSRTWSGSHPWEICQGGNSTHISLQVVPYKNGWQLYLEGFSSARAVETAKMSIALHTYKVPFILPHKEEMLRMLQGEDYIGIVPDNVTPRYCHACFPEKDHIYDFINLWSIAEDQDKLKDEIIWYPVQILELEKK